MQYLFNAAQTGRGYRHSQSSRQQTDTRLKAIDFTGIGALTLKKEQDRPILADQIPNVSESIMRSYFDLWNREGVEEQRHQPIQNAIPEPCIACVTLRVKTTVEVFFSHRHGDVETVS
jgi:hypothetical protein